MPVYQCRECSTPSKAIETVTFGADCKLKGGSQICLPCLTQWAKEHCVDWKQIGDLPRIVRAYIDAHRDPVKVLQERVRELEERLARANKTIENLNPQHKGLPGGR